MKKRFLSVVLALILSLSFAGNAFAASYHENDIEKYIIGQLSNAKIPGGEISIVTSGKEVYSASFGDVPETNSDLKIGSLSKIFTSISILQLIDSNKISFDTNIVDVISGSGNVPDITVEELLKADKRIYNNSENRIRKYSGTSWQKRRVSGSKNKLCDFRKDYRGGFG